LLRRAKHKGIDIIVTSSRDENRLREYMEALSFDLAEEDIRAISEIGDTNRKGKYVSK
jgi:diketogulonate reductase-like aldo/keto reductase